MWRRAPVALFAAALMLTACADGSPFGGGNVEKWDPRADVEPRTVEIPEARYTTTPQSQNFVIENLSGSTMYIAAAVPRGQQADLLVVDLPAYTPVAPEQRKPLRVTLDNRQSCGAARRIDKQVVGRFQAENFQSIERRGMLLIGVGRAEQDAMVGQI